MPVTPKPRVIRLRCRPSDRGQGSLLLVVAIPALVVGAMLLISMVGDGVQKRTETRTAADAAALGAATSWQKDVDSRFAAVIGSGPISLDAAAAFLLSDVTLFGDPESAARSYAARNGADLTSWSVRLDGDRLTFAAATRDQDAVNKTSRHMEADATASVRLRGGLCFSGRHLGLRLGGGCVATLPTVADVTTTVTVTPTPTTTTTPPPGPDPTTTTPTPTPTVTTTTSPGPPLTFEWLHRHFGLVAPAWNVALTS
jgi:hypothetical protein